MLPVPAVNFLIRLCLYVNGTLRYGGKKLDSNHGSSLPLNDRIYVSSYLFSGYSNLRSKDLEVPGNNSHESCSQAYRAAGAGHGRAQA